MRDEPPTLKYCTGSYCTGSYCTGSHCTGAVPDRLYDLPENLQNLGRQASSLADHLRASLAHLLRGAAFNRSAGGLGTIRHLMDLTLRVGHPDRLQNRAYDKEHGLYMRLGLMCCAVNRLSR